MGRLSTACHVLSAVLLVEEVANARLWYRHIRLRRGNT